MTALVLAILPPVVFIREDRAAHVEENTVVSKDTGQVLLRQLIWWDETEDGWHVVDWRIATARNHPRMTPDGSEYESMWHDGPVLRRVVAGSRSRTWSFSDREIDDRENLPLERRRRLR